MRLSRYIINIPLEISKRMAQRRLNDINTVLTASMMVSMEMPFTRALGFLVDMSNRIVNFDKCIIYFLDEEKGEVNLKYEKGFGVNLPPFFQKGNPLSRLTFEYGQPILIRSPEEKESIEIMKIARASSFLSLPIYSNGRVNGTIQFFKDQKDGFSKEDLILLNLLVIQFESMLTRILTRPPLDFLAIDPITDLSTRAFFENQVLREIERVRRENSSVSMLKVEIDRFDALMRDAGPRKTDIALREIADIHKKIGREIDIFSYFGQGMFVSLLPGADIEGALSAAKRLHNAIESHCFIGPDGTRNHQIRVFIGISSFPSEAKNPEDLFRTVDIALYRAKMDPVNRICPFSDVPTFTDTTSMICGSDAIDLEKLNKATNSVFNLDRLLNLVLQISIESLKARRGSLMIKDPFSSGWILKVARGFTSESNIIETARIKELGDISSWVVGQKRPIFSENIEELRDIKRKNRSRYRGKSFLSFPLIRDGDVYGLIHISEKQDGSPFIQRDLDLFKPLGIMIDSFLKDGMRFEHVQKDFIKKALALLIDIFECRNPHFLGHSRRVADISLSIGREIKLSEEDMDCLHFSSLCHDIGYIVLNDTICKKQTNLDLMEKKIFNQHPVLGEKILKTFPFLRAAGKIILSHHENYDGSGYPEGKMSEDIPLLSRILYVSESFDAMTSNRPYRKAFSKEKAIEEINSMSGRAFDPFIVDALNKAIAS